MHRTKAKNHENRPARTTRVGFMKPDIPEILKALARKRPVFHSETDFQHALAWQIHEMHPNLHPRLEYPFERPTRKACDIVLFRGGKMVMAIELKYPCRNLNYENKGEVFALKSAPADSGRHGTLKDIERMEEFIEEIQESENRTLQAAVIALTNDPDLWNGSKASNGTGVEFDIREGKVVSRTLKWAPRTSIKTKRAYPKIRLFGRYIMKWQNYSRVDESNGVFRYLHLPVQHPGTSSG